MIRIIQPSVAKRIAFSTWARKNGINRRSSVTYAVPDDIEVPDALMVGAQVDGKLVTPPKPVSKPKRPRAKKKAEPEVEKQTTEVQAEAQHVFNPVDYPRPPDNQED